MFCPLLLISYLRHRIELATVHEVKFSLLPLFHISLSCYSTALLLPLFVHRILGSSMFRGWTSLLFNCKLKSHRFSKYSRFVRAIRLCSRVAFLSERTIQIKAIVGVDIFIYAHMVVIVHTLGTLGARLFCFVFQCPIHFTPFPLTSLS